MNTRSMLLATAPLLVTLTACGGNGGGAGTGIVETNSGSIVTNEAQANQALESSNEQPPNTVAPADSGNASGTTNTQ